MATRPRSVRLGRDAWIEGAMDVLAERGLDAISVEGLARRLGVTKGSFYWHFEDRDELLAALFDRWEKVAVDGILVEVGPLADARGALTRLILRAFDIDPPKRRRVLRIEVAMAAAAEAHPLARTAFARVTRRRLQSVIALYGALGLDEKNARDRGLLAYTSLLGVYPVLLARHVAKGEREALAEGLRAALLP
jgi:AcrR family transcriptional regulator